MEHTGVAGQLEGIGRNETITANIPNVLVENHSEVANWSEFKAV